MEGANQQSHIAIPANAKVEVSGKATTDYLQTGQIVQFQAEIENHLIKGKIGQLSVVSLSPDRQMGIFPAGGADDQRGFGGEGGGKPGKARKAGSKILANGTYKNIVGKLTAPRGGSGKFTVLVARKKLTFQLGRSGHRRGRIDRLLVGRRR